MLKLKLNKTTSKIVFTFNKNLKVLLLLTLPFLAQLSCNTTEPTDDLRPGRRDYTWTVDTLNYPFAPLTRIWGNTPTDVWATSPGDWDKSISHFNGISWTSYGVSGMNVPSSIFGFAPNIIFIGTGGGGIWK